MSRRPQLFGKTLFVDFLMSNLAMLLGLMMLSDVSHQAERKRAQEAALKTDGVYAIVTGWPDASPDDVDLYVRDPSGRIAYFSARDVGLMHLEHDDQGTTSDQISTPNGQIKVERNEERVILRGTMTGEYVVSVHMYNKRSPGPTAVSVSLYRLKGEDEELVRKERLLKTSGQEATAFRFSVREDGTVSDINELERPIVNGSGGRPGGF